MTRFLSILLLAGCGAYSPCDDWTDEDLVHMAGRMQAHVYTGLGINDARHWCNFMTQYESTACCAWMAIEFYGRDALDSPEGTSE